ncbi:MAG TPA: four helix bundle protein [Gemmatimonadaceae bacterium]|nr:four helix bundle protein [Gemmatimonadaceae bacterium]
MRGAREGRIATGPRRLWVAGSWSLVIGHRSPTGRSLDAIVGFPWSSADVIASAAGRYTGLMQDFRRLAVWERAHALTLAIKQAVRTFPCKGNSELKAQLLRASDSIVSNIVEGCGAASRREFARYLDISIKSASEVDYRLQLARDDGCLRFTTWRDLSEQVVRIRKMLFTLRRAVLAADDYEDVTRKRRQNRKPMTNDQ